MKKYILCITVLLLLVFNCNLQNAENKKQQSLYKEINLKEMEHNTENLHDNLKNYIPIKEFDIKKFNAKCGERSSYHFVDENGMEVEQWVNDEFSPRRRVFGYTEKRRFPNSAYMFYSEYDANGKLIKTHISFHGMVTEFIYFYNTDGEIIKKEDRDMPYKFSIDNLIRKMEKEYNVDIVDTRICNRVLRGVYGEYNNIPLYEVCLFGISRTQVICYLIDGNTGETLFTTTRNLRELRESIADEYLNSLKK